MKKIAQLSVYLSLLLIILFAPNCNKEEILKITKLKTGAISEIKYHSARASATFTDLSGNVTEFGHCWNTSGNPTTSDPKSTVSGTASKDEYFSDLTGLTAGTKYYVKAYAIDAGSIIYGSQVEFTTTSYELPVLTTKEITEIDHETASSGGEISFDGGTPVTARGVCWGISQNPTTSDNKTSNGTGTGTYTSNINGLSANTTYYVRAYATNAKGTSYGNQQNFTTDEAPSITITSPTPGTHWIGNEKLLIKWDATNVEGDVSINLVKQSSQETVITSGVLASSNQFEWTVPSNQEYRKDYSIKITSVNNSSIYAESELFTLSEANGSTGTMVGLNFSYNTIKIGYQWWMAENLQEFRYPDGTTIPVLNDNNNSGSTNDEWANLDDSNTDDACCYIKIEPFSYLNTYGRLYTFSAAIADNWIHDNSDGQGICPDGWHLPTDYEWKELEIYLGMSQSEADKTGFRGSNEGSKMAGNASLWYNGNLDANAAFGSSGFTALPGGYRYFLDGDYVYMEYTGNWWSATEASSTEAVYRFLVSDHSEVAWSRWNKSNGFSVRCVKDY